MNKQMTAISIFIALGVGFATGYLFTPAPAVNTATTLKTASNKDEPDVLFWRNPMNPAITSPIFMQDEMGMDYIPVYAESNKPKAKEVLFWRNPMNPAITSTVFMQDEMGMDYIPVYANNSAQDEPAGTVTIDPVTVQNIGVRTQIVKQQTLTRQLSALGRIDFNEERLSRLHPKTSGWIEELKVDETGIKVKHDTILLSIYSPELVAAQQEYLVALDNWEKTRNSSATQVKRSAQRILESARERLELFDVPAHQIHELKSERKIKKQLHIHSPFNGRIMHIGSREGQYVTPKDELYLIADLSRIWVNVDVFEDELSWLNIGDQAEMRVRATPGKSYKGKITFIHPTLNSKSRTAKVRLEFDNPDLRLKPGMFANVILFTNPQVDAITVPSEAVVRSGHREQVFVVREPGKFEPREVTLGINANGLTQILSGVSAGEQVVTSSQFLIDSESKLREATAKMMAAMDHRPETEMEMNMDMNMDDMQMDDMSIDMPTSNMGMSDMEMESTDIPESSMDTMSTHDMQEGAHNHDH